MKPEFEPVAKALMRQWNIYFFDRDEDAGWELEGKDAEFAWFLADKVAKAKGYISLWSLPREQRQEFLDKAIEGFRESYT